MELEEYNKKNAKPHDKILNLLDGKTYNVAVLDEHGIYTSTKLYSFPYTPRLDYKDFKIIA
jgi:hypothetical protein